MIRSILMDGLILGGLTAMAYAVWERPDPTSVLVVGAASFFLGILGGRHK